MISWFLNNSFTILSTNIESTNIESTNIESTNIESTNIESINATLVELYLFLKDLETNGFQFGAICIQESWLSENDDISLFHLSNYYCIAQTKHVGTREV